MQLVLVAITTNDLFDGLIVLWLHIGIDNSHMAGIAHLERMGFRIGTTISIVVLRQRLTIRGNSVFAGIQLTHRIGCVIREIIGLHTSKLAFGQSDHTVRTGETRADNLIGGRIVNAVFAFIWRLRAIGEQLELELLTGWNSAQCLLFNVNGLGRLHRQIEADLAVGATVATFQIEETQMMGFICSGIPVLARITECLANCRRAIRTMTLSSIIRDFLSSKINRSVYRLMDTAQVKHQHIIDEHPHIVVTGEIKHHVLIVDFAIFRHIEIGPKVHAERIPIGVAVIAKRREQRVTIPALGLLGQFESIAIAVIFRIFRRRIETVIPLTIRSQQTTFRRVISHSLIRRTAEEIIQRSVAIRHGRIIVSQQRLHNARVRTSAILNIAVIAGFVSSAHKMQRMIIVDGVAIVIMQTNADTILLLNSGIDVIG